MKTWLPPLLLLFGVAGAWAGDQTPPHKIEPGETLGSIGKQFGYDWRALCTFNQLASCHVIQAGATIRFPDRGTIVKRSTEPSSCITLGVAPFNPEHDLAEMLRGIDRLTQLTPEQKDLAREKVVFGEKATEDELVGQQVFGEMLYRSTKPGRKVEHVYGKPICSPEQGGQPEVMDTYDLGEGVMLAIPRRCGNPSIFMRQKRALLPPPPEEVLPPPPAPPASAPVVDAPVPEPVPQEVAPKEAVRRWDWEAVIGQEHDRTSHSTHGSGAVYGLIVEDDGAEHAFGIGVTGSQWHGKTDTGFGFNGQLHGVGPAYRYSAYEGGWDFGLKLLPWASLTENGDAGAYQSHRQFDLRGMTLAYNNYARELKGEKSFFKYQLFVSAYKPTGESEVGHSWEGKPISDTVDLQKLSHVVNIGGRVGLYDFSEEDDAVGAKLWLAGGWFQEAPSLAESANWRIQWSDKHERLFVGFGRNYDLLNGGSLLGFGWTWDIRKTVYVNREESRRAQFIAAIEKAGGSLDKDGMVRLPKGAQAPKRQYKTAPSDD